MDRASVGLSPPRQGWGSEDSKREREMEGGVGREGEADRELEKVRGGIDGGRGAACL